MSDVIIVAIISFVGTLAGTFAGIVTSSKLTNYRIEQLEKKVEEHNKVVDRVYQLEQRNKDNDELFSEKFKVVNHRIEDLEEYHK